MSIQNLSGIRFGRLFVTSMLIRDRNSQVRWYFVCDCGNIILTLHNNLLKHRTESCGCLQKERAAFAQLKHGNNKRTGKSAEYRSWISMKARCCNTKSEFYSEYGGRGIKVCLHWLDSFENFLKDMGERPSKNHSIDRIDVNGDYCPENCRWATDKQQARNKRNNVYLEYKGEKRLLLEIAEEVGMNQKILHQRISRGWDITLAIETPQYRQSKYRN
jgi:hypothetical protein